MRTRGTMAFLVSVAAVVLMILCAATQLMGTFWFHKATRMDHGGGISLETMESALRVQPLHSLYRFSIGRELQDRSRDTRLTLVARRDLLIEAGNYLGGAIALEPSASLYHYHLGWIYVALTPHWPVLQKRAHVAFSRSTSLNPTNALFRWGVADYYLNQYALALKGHGKNGSSVSVERARKTFQRHFRAFLEVQPHSDPSPVLHRCFATTRDYEDLKGLIPDRPPRHRQLAEFLDQKGMWDHARTEFELAISQNPTNLRAYDAYASALFVHKLYEEALTLWKRQQAVNPDDPQSYRTLSRAFWRLGRKKEAVAEVEHLVAVHPHEPLYRLELAARLGAAGNPGKALQVCQVALDMDPDNPRIYSEMARNLARQGDLAEAEASLRRAISLSPSEIGYQDQLARLFFGQKQYARAIDHWQRVLKMNPKNIRSLKGIALSYERLGDRDGALHYYRKALILDPDDRSIVQGIERMKRTSG